MNQDFMIMFLKNALQTAMKSGGTTFFDELLDGMQVNQLDWIRSRVERALNKKKTTVEVNVK